MKRSTDFWTYLDGVRMTKVGQNEKDADLLSPKKGEKKIKFLRELRPLSRAFWVGYFGNGITAFRYLTDGFFLKFRCKSWCVHTRPSGPC